MTEVLSGKKRGAAKGGRSKLARALMGATDSHQLVVKVQGLLKDTLLGIASRNTVNLKCFEV